MNNGLRGRYLNHLEAWNDARQFAADLIAAYYASGRELHDVLARWNQQAVEFPTLSELKRMVNRVLFNSARDAIDEIARAALTWSGWFQIESPVQSAGRTVETTMAVV